MHFHQDWEAKENAYNSQIEDLKDLVETHKTEVLNLEHRLRLNESSKSTSDNIIAMLENKVADKDERIRE